MKIKLILLLLLCSLVQISCKKKNAHPVPLIPTDITINIYLPSYSALTGVGGWAYVAGASKGIVVYRRGVDDFVAFDRHSPANDGKCDQALVINVDNFLILDDLCSGAQFSLYDGSPISGSDWGLRQLQTTWDGSDQLRIFN